MTRIVRTAEARDAAGIALAHVECWREAYGHFLSDEYLDRRELETFRQRWERTLAEPPVATSICVLDVGGEVRGFAMSGPSDDGEGRELFAIYQFASEHGSGSGAELLEAVLLGESASLWVAEKADRARAFYARNGFTPTGEQKIEEAIEGISVVRMAR